MKSSLAVFTRSILFTVALGGCASDQPHQGGSPEPGAVVVMHFHSFAPSTVTIRMGETVRWDNASILWHTVTDDATAVKDPTHVSLPERAEPFDSGKVEPGDSYSRTFTSPGTYPDVCRPHEGNGISGNRIVPVPCATSPPS